jgi:hypothetical protein
MLSTLVSSAEICLPAHQRLVVNIKTCMKVSESVKQVATLSCISGTPFQSK